MGPSLCPKDVHLAWNVVTLSAGRVAMYGKIVVYGMIVAAVADVLTAVACWFIVFMM